MEIKNIIKEEFQNFLTEGYVMEHDNFRFRQELTNSSFYNFKYFSNDFDVDISESDIFINWRIGFWLNANGIESFLVKADSVEGTYKVTLLNKQTDEVEQETEKNIGDEPWKFQIYDATLKLKDTLYIESLDFDFKTKICTVTFFNNENQPQLNEGVVDEISRDLMTRATDKMAQKGQTQRANNLKRNFDDRDFAEFLHKPIFRNQVIPSIRVVPNSNDSGNMLQISHTSDRSVEFNRTHGSITYDFNSDAFWGEPNDMSRQDARFLSKIAMKVNPNTKYKNGVGDFHIKGY